MNISGIREDSRLLQHWYKTKFTSLDMINKLVKKPLLVIPTEIASTLVTMHTSEEIEYYLNSLPNSFNAVYSDVSVQHGKYLQYFKDNNNITIIFIMNIDEYILTVFNKNSIEITPDTVKLFNFITEQPINTEKEILTFLKKESSVITVGAYKIRQTLTNKKILHNSIIGMLGICAEMAKMAMEADEYPVIVQREKKDTQNITSKKSWKRKDLPRLIFMNAPKTKVIYTNDIKNSLGNTHASPILHRRKGHYRTLRHPKYKNHPMYMVEDGIYIRATWVGDTEYSHEGNRYTVIINDPNKGFDNG